MKSYDKIAITAMILDYLKYNREVTSKELAEEFNISRREVFRYVKELKAINVIVTYRGRYGYIDLARQNRI